MPVDSCSLALYPPLLVSPTLLSLPTLESTRAQACASPSGLRLTPGGSEPLPGGKNHYPPRDNSPLSTADPHPPLSTRRLYAGAAFTPWAALTQNHNVLLALTLEVPKPCVSSAAPLGRALPSFSPSSSGHQPSLTYGCNLSLCPHKVCLPVSVPFLPSYKDTRHVRARARSNPAAPHPN